MTRRLIGLTLVALFLAPIGDAGAQHASSPSWLVVECASPCSDYRRVRFSLTTKDDVDVCVEQACMTFGQFKALFAFQDRLRKEGRR